MSYLDCFDKEALKSLSEGMLEFFDLLDKRDQEHIKAYNKAVEEGKPLQWIKGSDVNGSLPRL